MSGMTGRSRKPPKGDVRPLGAPLPVRREQKAKVPKFVETAAYAGIEALNDHARKVEAVQIANPEATLAEAKKVVDTAPLGGVSLPQSPIQAPSSEIFSRRKTMTLTLKGLSKNGKNAFYSGAAQTIRISLGAFVNKTAPQAIEVEGDFAAPKAAKVKLSPAERKAANAAKPKPTLAERIAQRETALAKLKAQAASDGGHASL